ncbi:hypothetical protein EJB05_28573, partial [Eragrostis curvula]
MDTLICQPRYVSPNGAGALLAIIGATKMKYLIGWRMGYIERKNGHLKGTAATTTSSGAAPMDHNLLEAATCGDATFAKHLTRHNPGVLLGTTPQGNTCLHI